MNKKQVELKLNILIIVSDVTLSGRTGDAVHVREVTENLANMGHRIFLVGRDLQNVTSGEYNQFQRSLKSLESHENVELHPMKSKANLSILINRDFQTLKTSMKIMKENRIDMIYSRNFNSYIEVFLMKLFEVPAVLEINGLTIDERALLTGAKKSFLIKFLKSIAKYCFSKILKIITVTGDLKNQLMEDYQVPAEKITVVNNGVNEKLYRPSNRLGIETRKLLKVDPGKKLICFVGTFLPWHGLDGLVDAAKIVIKKEPDALFLLVGDGPLKKSIKDKVKNNGLNKNFIFTGHVSYESVTNYINASQVCVTPYSKVVMLKEFSPIKIYAYLSCGKPVVTTNIAGVSDVVKKSGAGIVVQADEPAKLASGILKIINDEKKQKLFGRKGRKYIEKNCTWKQTAEKVSEVLINVKSTYEQ